MIVLFFDVVLFLIVTNLNYVLINTINNTLFDTCIYLYLVFCIFILPMILMIQKNERAVICHFISLIIINFVVFYNYHLSLHSLCLSLFILETLFLFFRYIKLCKKQVH